MTSKTVAALWDAYKARRVLGKKTEPEIVRQYERYVAPVLGAKRADRVTFQMIDTLHHDMRGTPYQANRVLALLRTMFSYAEALRWIGPGTNPARAVVAFPERKRRRHMGRAEAPRIAQAITEREGTAPEACLFLWLLIFTGARPSEIKAARWSNLVGNVITLDDHKTADKTGTDRIIVLPAAAMEKLNKLAGDRQPSHKIIPIGTPEYVWRKLRVNAGCHDLRVYDLRHTFGSYALQQGYNLDQIGEALAHTDPKTTKIYAELTTRNREKMATDTSMAILHDMGVADYVPTLRELT